MKCRGLGLILIASLVASAAAGRYVPTQYPQTAAVLQVLFGDAVRKEHTFLAYAAGAEEEGSAPMVALFAALARSQSVLAENARLLLAEFDTEVETPLGNGVSVGETRHNLEITANIALAKLDDRYRVFLDMIRAERNAEAMAEVQAVWDVKKRQREIVQKGLSATGLLGWTAKLPQGYCVCPVCGYIVAEGDAGARCPYCNTEGIENEVVGSEWKVFWGLDQNTALDDAQRAAAKRFYRLVASQDVGLAPAPGSTLLGSDAYQMWGLGSSGGFSDEEKAYIAAVPLLARAWEVYQAIDLGELSENEKQYIARIHTKYGQGPVDLMKLREGGDLSGEAAQVLDIVEALSGSLYLSDRDLVFLQRFDLE
ncbi:MAG TPA: rubrerythrin family protein [Phycisphaerales bacterium]|nr:rubrerythrin family protein [Phycisphaerales bacterium]